MPPERPSLTLRGVEKSDPNQRATAFAPLGRLNSEKSRWAGEGIRAKASFSCYSSKSQVLNAGQQLIA